MCSNCQPSTTVPIQNGTVWTSPPPKTTCDPIDHSFEATYSPSSARTIIFCRKCGEQRDLR